MRIQGFNQITTKSFLYAVMLLSISLLSACVPSPNPTTEELIKTSVPTFNGLNNIQATTPSPTFVLSGECDIISRGIEYSFDNNTWVLLAPDCLSGTFTMTTIVNGIKNVYVRAKTKLGYTAAAHARIRLLLPPTSKAFQTVTAGSAVSDGDMGGMQFSMSHGLSEGHNQGATTLMQSGITGVVYGP